MNGIELFDANLLPRRRHICKLYRTLGILAMGLLASAISGCITLGSSRPQAQDVNPAIEERIQAQLVNKDDRRTPDLAAIPTGRPELASPPEQAAARQRLVERGQVLVSEIARERAKMPTVSPEERAEALRIDIERDRAAAAAEGSAADKVKAAQR
ncbi:MAG: hypothetical protein AAF986_00945 [Pseudomonadota bacterium]